MLPSHCHDQKKISHWVKLPNSRQIVENRKTRHFSGLGHWYEWYESSLYPYPQSHVHFTRSFFNFATLKWISHGQIFHKSLIMMMSKLCGLHDVLPIRKKNGKDITNDYSGFRLQFWNALRLCQTLVSHCDPIRTFQEFTKPTGVFFTKACFEVCFDLCYVSQYAWSNF